MQAIPIVVMALGLALFSYGTFVSTSSKNAKRIIALGFLTACLAALVLVAMTITQTQTLALSK